MIKVFSSREWPRDSGRHRAACRARTVGRQGDSQGRQSAPRRVQRLRRWGRHRPQRLDALIQREWPARHQRSHPHAPASALGQLESHRSRCVTLYAPIYPSAPGRSSLRPEKPRLRENLAHPANDHGHRAAAFPHRLLCCLLCRLHRGTCWHRHPKRSYADQWPRTMRTMWSGNFSGPTPPSARK